MTVFSDYKKIKDRYLQLLEPLGRGLAKLHVHPHVLTVAGFVLSSVTAYLLGRGYLLAGGLVLILAGNCDLLDGALARALGKASRRGAIFDSIVDRYSEVVIFLGLAYHYDRSQLLYVIMVAMAGSFMVSYVRARAEGIGVTCTIGFFRREERLITLIAGTILGAIPFVGSLFMALAISLIAVMANVTALQRIVYVLKQTREMPPTEAPADVEGEALSTKGSQGI